MEFKSYLIKDTTREEREQIVRESLGYDSIGCECGDDTFDMYWPYIEGKMELREISMNFHTEYATENDEADPMRTGNRRFRR